MSIPEKILENIFFKTVKKIWVATPKIVAVISFSSVVILAVAAIEFGIPWAKKIEARQEIIENKQDTILVIMKDAQMQQQINTLENIQTINALKFSIKYEGKLTRNEILEEIDDQMQTTRELLAKPGTSVPKTTFHHKIVAIPDSTK